MPAGMIVEPNSSIETSPSVLLKSVMSTPEYDVDEAKPPETATPLSKLTVFGLIVTIASTLPPSPPAPTQ